MRFPLGTNHRHTRREALKIFGAGVVAAGAPALAMGETAADPPLQHRPFTLAEVRLGTGPFLDAQRRDADYLLKLEPDRMLANFRANAGLAPRAPVYGGWESVEPWIDIRCHGHTLGHYLGAAACMYQVTGDARFAERVDYIVAELAECQAKTAGWLTAFPDGVAPLADSLEVLEAEAERVHARVTRRTDHVGPVLLQHLANRRGLPELALVQVGVGVCRWWRHRRGEDVLEQPLATNRRRGACRIRRDGEHTAPDPDQRRYLERGPGPSHDRGLTRILR